MPSSSAWLSTHATGHSQYAASSQTESTPAQNPSNSIRVGASEANVPHDADEDDEQSSVDGRDLMNESANRTSPIGPSQHREDSDDSARFAASAAQLQAGSLEQLQAAASPAIPQLHGGPPLSEGSLGVAYLAGRSGETVSEIGTGITEGLVFSSLRSLSVQGVPDGVGGSDLLREPPTEPPQPPLTQTAEPGACDECARLLDGILSVGWDREWSRRVLEFNREATDFFNHLAALTPDDEGATSRRGSLWLAAAALAAGGAVDAVRIVRRRRQAVAPALDFSSIEIEDCDDTARIS
jgi:hypothetical protein